ncbi:MAG TPA: hypothetical protein VEQ59_24015 [Polyangiaceae bacterium]|nr:hypothetical protein [Polyangiaceae bacterium]
MSAPASHEMAVGSAGKLQTTLGELRLQIDASIEELEAITARTSKVLAATEAFSALGAECRAVSRALFDPELSLDLQRRQALARRVQQLSERFVNLRQSYAMIAPLRPRVRKPWWRWFK